ncbi:hypothetical protein AKJ16_DCAP26397, partial [Drosera capensis]
MEEETIADQEEAEVIGSLTTAPGSLEERDFKWEHEDESWDGGFVKVEKDEQPFFREHSPDTESVCRQIPEVGGKITQLEIELERLAQALQESKLENAQLEQELSLTREKFNERERSHIKLEREHKRLQEKLQEAEENFAGQLATLQEALQEEEAKNRQLMGIKEAFDSLNLEPESSKKNTERLERELQSSVEELRKFEKLHTKTTSIADLERKKALRFENLLEEAKLDAKEREDQIDYLQNELEGLHEKLAENEDVQEALESTSAELSTAQKELQATKANLINLQKTISSRDAQIDEVMQELDQLRGLEHQLKEQNLAMGSLLSSTEDDLLLKTSELEGIELQLKEEVYARVSAEDALQICEEQVTLLKDELAKAAHEKRILEGIVADLTSSISLMKENYADFEKKLNISDEEFDKRNLLLVESLRNHTKLEERLKSQQKLHEETEAVAASYSNRILELEEIIHASNAATEEAKLKFQGLELEFKAAENRNIELEQQLTLAETSHADVEWELKESNEKIFELEVKLQEMEAENEQANRQIEEYKAKLTQVELALGQARLRSSELEEELKKVVEQSAAGEGRANATHQRSRELEDLLQNSHSKVDGSEKRIGELESLMEEQKGRIQELEEQMPSLQKKYEKAQTESKAHQQTVFELRSEVQKLELSRSDLEEAIQIAHDKERNLTILLQDGEEEKKKAEKELSSLIRKLQETEKLLDECKGKIAELESALTQTRLNNINLEEEMK